MKKIIIFVIWTCSVVYGSFLISAASRGLRVTSSETGLAGGLIVLFACTWAGLAWRRN